MINFGFETNDRKLESPLSPVIDHLQEDRRMKTSDYYPIVTETCTICISRINSWAQGIQIAGLGHGPMSDTGRDYWTMKAPLRSKGHVPIRKMKECSSTILGNKGTFKHRIT